MDRVDALQLSRQPASILVTLPDGKRAAARIVARDFSRELALLKVTKWLTTRASGCPVSEVTVGQWAIALGKTSTASRFRSRWASSVRWVARMTKRFSAMPRFPS